MFPLQTERFSGNEAEARIISRMAYDKNEGLSNPPTFFQSGANKLRANSLPLLPRRYSERPHTESLPRTFGGVYIHRAKDDMSNDLAFLLCDKRENQMAVSAQSVNKVGFVRASESGFIHAIDGLSVGFSFRTNSNHIASLSFLTRLPLNFTPC